MKQQNPTSSSAYLAWPLGVLFFLTIGVFLTTREVPKQQETKSHAQTPTASSSAFGEEGSELIPTDIPPTLEPTETPTPVGEGIILSFTLPGISSQGGNIRPVHPERDITLSFYDRDDNILDGTVKPIYQYQGKASYDADPSSPTYTSFINNTIDLGTHLPDGEYQIALKTDQSLQKIYKARDKDLGGKIFTINNNSTLELLFQSLLVGDIIPVPKGNNSIDIADYNAFIDCFGIKQDSPDCTAKQGADFDDNGVVDGIDYNIMLRSFQSLLSQGFSVPTLAPSKSPITKTNPSKTITPSVTPNQRKGLNPLGIIFTIIVLAWAGFSAFTFLRGKRHATKPDKGPTTIQPTAAKEEPVEEKEYYIKKQADDEDKKGVWVTLTDDNGPHLAHYSGTDLKEGFAHIKGTTKKEKDKTFIEISKIISDEQK